MKRSLWLLLGWVSLTLAAVGTVVPLLPTVPFVLLAACSFAHGSQRICDWFMGTRLYREHAEGVVTGRGITLKAKVRTCAMVTVLLAVGFIAMSGSAHARLAIAVVWLAHMLFFAFKVPTLR